MHILLTHDRDMENIANCIEISAKYAPAQDSSHLGVVLPQGQTNSKNVPANME